MVRQITLAFVTLAITGTALASPLGLVPPPLNPDVSAITTAVSYSATSHVLSITGNTQNGVFPPNASFLMGNRQFTLTCNIDNAGNILPGGQSLIVRGDASAAGTQSAGANALLMSSSSLSQFGFSVSNKLEFVFTGGTGIWWQNASYTAGVIVTLPGAFSSNGNLPRFTQDFSYNFPSSGTVDSFLIPAPGAMGLLGLAGLTVSRRRR